eukprot:scaffold21283_cov107-Isochrysis_galbana.AAC.1
MEMPSPSLPVMLRSSAFHEPHRGHGGCGGEDTSSTKHNALSEFVHTVHANAKFNFVQRLFPPHTPTLASDGQRAAADRRRLSGGGGHRRRELEAPPICGLSGGGRRAAGAAGVTVCRGCGSPFRSLEEEALGACRVAWTCSVGSGGASQVRWCLAPGGRVGPPPPLPRNLS